MRVKAGQIYRARRVSLGKADYSRPLAVMHTGKIGIQICCFSTKFSLCDSDDLTIDERDDGFKETGLKESSYLVRRSASVETAEFFQGATLIGEFTGELKRRVEEWWGEAFS